MLRSPRPLAAAPAALSLALLSGCTGIAGSLDTGDEGACADDASCAGSDDPDELDDAVPQIELAPLAPGADPVLDRLRPILNRMASYQLRVWWPATGYDGGGATFVVDASDEASIRPITAVASALAITLATGAYDEAAVGVPRAEAQRIAIRMIRSLAAAHRANGGAWGDGWQTALWTSSTGLAAWLLWEELSAGDQRLVTRMILREADNFLAYQVPYHRDPIGRVLTPGDTKAEENSWNSRVLSLALTMFPGHSSAAGWREKKIELQVSAYAAQVDVNDPTPVHGRPLCRWLGGFNALSSGYLINHRRLHPGYMRTPHHAADALHSLLAGRPADLAAVLNLDRTYAALIDVSFTSPPALPPGGAAYRPGSSDLYFPHADDWGGNGYVQFMSHDLQADALRFDTAASRPASSWIDLRIARVEQQMARFSDGRVYAEGEARSPMAEQDAFEKSAEGYLTRFATIQRPLEVTDESYVSGPAGCPAREADLSFCPADGVKRAHMAAFLMRLRHGGEFVPLPPTGMFSDVDPGNLFIGEIEQLAREGVTSGCAAGRFCPDDLVRRDQMATFLVRFRYGPDYVPPAAQGLFEDVPTSSVHAPAIEQLYRDGIVNGCAAGRYCPGDLLTRAQMATLLVRVSQGPGYQPPPARGVFDDVPASNIHAPAIEHLYDAGITLGCR